jgi:zeaxanthin glucosyltransferase
VIGDQLDIAAGTVAESMGLPYITLSCAPPIYLDESVPPPYFGWQPSLDPAGRRRNARANSLLERLMEPMLEMLNRQRRDWKLPAVNHIHDLFSKRAIISQLPRFLEFARPVPAHLHYTAQFRDECVEKSIRFDWSRLSGRPLAFASMGTIRNTSVHVFRTIAAACARFDVQLVLSLGGVHLSARDLGELPQDTVVVPYAPQRALLKRAVLAINCAGLNTTLECLRNGVPMVALPAGEDQPGVAARLATAKAGVVLPAHSLSSRKLTGAIREVLENERYRTAAATASQQLQRMNGVEDAIDLIEKAA